MAKTTFYEQLSTMDWLGRSEDDYTYEKRGLTFGWEETLTKGEPISNFIIRVGKDSELNPHRKITLVKQACEMLKSRMLIGEKVNTIITFTSEFENYATNDKTKICVTLEPLSTTDPSLTMPTFNHALDPILGYLVHEMAHIVYTEPAYGEHIMKFKGDEQKLKAMIMNVIEDERIEHNVSIDFGGYVGYLGKAKDYCFGKKYEAEKKLIEEFNANNTAGALPQLSKIEQLANVFIHLLRYPRALEPDQVNEIGRAHV